MKLSRRTFVSASAAALFARAELVPALPAFGATVDPDNVLVVVYLNGGNDGLNTVVPWSDDAYHRARPAIRIKESEVLKLDDRIGLNPALKPLMPLVRDGNLAILQGVGYPKPNRSHFEATQIWETAALDRPQSTGWLGRYLDATQPPRRAGDLDPDLFRAVALGDALPQALIASHVEVPAIGQLNAFAYNTGKDVFSKASAGVLYDGARPGASPYLGLIADVARAAYHGGDSLRAKTAGYTPAVTYANDPFSQQMRLAAQLIAGGARTRIVFASLGSFDTHANQRVQQDRLLGYLAQGLASFHADLTAHGVADRVLTLTFSEFGRRVAQNGSGGTDHGTALPVFVLGGRVKGGIHGDHPSLTDLDAGDVRFGTDFRAVYATVIERWLGRRSDDLLGAGYQAVDFV